LWNDPNGLVSCNARIFNPHPTQKWEASMSTKTTRSTREFDSENNQVVKTEYTEKTDGTYEKVTRRYPNELLPFFADSIEVEKGKVDKK